MVKFDQLKLDQLKKELSKYNLPTSGNKAELQKRLMDEFESQGLDIDSYEFEGKDELELSTRSTAGGMDLSTMFAAMMEKMEANNKQMVANNKQMVAQLQEDSRTNMRQLRESMLADIETKLQEELQENSRINNEKLLAEMETSRINNAQMLADIEVKLEEISGSTDKKLQEISETINNRVDGIEEEVDKVKKSLGNVDKKFGDVDKKFGDFEAKFNDLQHQGGPVRVVQEISGKTNTPTFDGSVPFNVFKFQFETVAEKNLWGNDQKAVELILALKGNAAEVLESVPESSRKNFDDIMGALQRKYGGEHKIEIYRLELRSRVQKPNETLQDFALDIERLVQLIHPGKDQSFLDPFKIEAFVHGIRDPDLKFAVCATPKPTFAETLSLALSQEAAKIIARQQIYKVRGVDVVSEAPRSMEQIIEAFARLEQTVKHAVNEKENKSKTKCYNCGKVGHFQRNCKAPKKQLTSPGNSQRVGPESSSEEQTLN